MRATSVCLTGALLILSLAACSGPGPDEAATALAHGLTSGNLSAVRLTGASGEQAQQQRDEIVAGLGKASETVTVRSVSDTGEQATASLHHVWRLPKSAGERTWEYDTTAQLSRGDDGWATRWQPSVVADVRPGETLALERTQPARAAVLGAGASTLVSERPVSRFGIDKSAVPADQAEASARALAGLLGVDPAQLASRVAKAGPRQFVEALTLRADAVPQPVRDGYAAIPGAHVVAGTQPLAPTSQFARPVLGSVGPVTAEVLRRRPQSATGDQVGLSGLQYHYDDLLVGTVGVAVRAGAPGGTARTLFEAKAVPGTPLQTTLDETLQTRAESLLAGVAPASAIVVVRPSTGQVLAAASGPGGKGHSTATLGKFAPGSTFKVVTALALLRRGLTPDSPVQCPASITVDGRAFGNYSDFPADRVGTMTLRDALALSCNTAFISAAEGITPDELAKASASLGTDFGTQQLGAVGYDAEVPRDVTSTEAAAARIGQGKVTASPLAMTTVVASVAHGATVTPRLVDEPATAPASSETPPLTATEAQQLQTMMAAVVTDGSGRVLRSVPTAAGQQVIAKTGTAEFGDATPPATRAWMIAARGDLAVGVFVAEGASGSSAAGPIMAEMLTRTAP